MVFEFLIRLYEKSSLGSGSGCMVLATCALLQCGCDYTPTKMASASPRVGNFHANNSSMSSINGSRSPCEGCLGFVQTFVRGASHVQTSTPLLVSEAGSETVWAVAEVLPAVVANSNFSGGHRRAWSVVTAGLSGGQSLLTGKGKLGR